MINHGNGLLQASIPSNVRNFPVRRRLAYRIQEIYYGGLSEADRQLLEQIADGDPQANLRYGKNGGAFSLLEKFSGRNWNFILPQKEFEHRKNGRKEIRTSGLYTRPGLRKNQTGRLS